MRREDPGLFPWRGCPDPEAPNDPTEPLGSRTTFGLTPFSPTGFTLQAPFQGMLRLPQFVQQVVQGPQWMTICHPRTGKAHHVLRHLPFSWLVAVDRTIRTGWLVGTIRTLLKPPRSVLHQSGTLRTQTGCMMIAMVMLAINSSHADQCVVFSFQSAGESAHGSIIGASTVHHSDPNQAPGEQTICYPDTTYAAPACKTFRPGRLADFFGLLG